MTLPQDAAPPAAADALPLLEVQGLSLALTGGAAAAPLVGPLDFAIRRGEAVGLVGESGSGKSLSALALLGLLPPGVQLVQGHIRWHDGADFAALTERQLRPYRGGAVAYIFQDPATALNPVLRVGHQVEEVLRVHRPELAKAERRARLRQLFQEVELADAVDGSVEDHPGDKLDVILRRYPHQLSGGQRQRVLLAAALAGDPELLVADEPTTALDVTIEWQILALLRRLQEARGLTMLWISHDLALIRHLCSRVLVLYRGQLVEQGPTEQLFTHPEHAHTRALVAAATADAKPASASGASETVLEVQDLSVRYPSPPRLFGRTASATVAVDHVSFRLGAGQTLGLVGESGSGKSSLARAILGLEEEVTGRVCLRPPGEAVIPWSELSESKLRPLRRHVGMVFQDPATALDPRLPLWRTVAEPLEIHRPCPRAELRAAAERLLKRVGLDQSFLDRLPASLSGGQAQRVGIARAVALDPCLVVCDEALSALDLTIQEQILALLQELQEASGISYLFISHDLEMVARLADQVLVLRAGRVVEAGPTAAVLGDPQQAYTRELLAASHALHSGS